MRRARPFTTRKPVEENLVSRKKVWKNVELFCAGKKCVTTNTKYPHFINQNLTDVTISLNIALHNLAFCQQKGWRRRGDLPRPNLLIRNL